MHLGGNALRRSTPQNEDYHLVVREEFKSY